FINLILMAIVMFYGWPLWTMTAFSVPMLAGGAFLIARRNDRKVNTGSVTLYRKQKRPDGGNELVPQEEAGD
ncbi:MAG: hypothetical protein IIB28_07360, partial [Chloroflexi bacterium]|nr:hypothetical protein [Chloroflexota bacterium]